jgi:hypothetical protein
MSERNVIHYYSDALPGGRAQLMRDVVVDGKIVPELSGPIGSPAPAATVREHERLITLDSPPADIGDLGDQILLAEIERQNDA